MATAQKTHQNLKLRAEDPHDLQIIGSLVQDALLPVTAMHYSKKDQVFTVLANRFCWETDPTHHEGEPMYHRIHAGLHFGHIHKIRHQALDHQDPTRVLNLLMVHGDREGEIHLCFSGGTNVCLHAEKILCYLQDLHEPWYTHQSPDHFWHERTPEG